MIVPTHTLIAISRLITTPASRITGSSGVNHDGKGVGVGGGLGGGGGGEEEGLGGMPGRQQMY